MPKHLIDHLDDIPDPRSGNHLRHHLIDILTIALTATICAIDSFTDMEEFGYARKEWFESFLKDEQRMCVKNSAQNMALMRRCVVNLLK